MRSARSAVIVAPVPPPYGGQTLMVSLLVQARCDLFPDWHIDVVPVRYSRTLSDMGRPSPKKVLHALTVVLRTWRVAFMHRPRILYYTPAGPTRLAVLRDIAVLTLIRPCFKQTIFHFHAGGVGDVYSSLSRAERWLFRRAYFNADLGIRTSPAAPRDPDAILSERSVVVPNGVQDMEKLADAHAPPAEDTGVLYVGLISPRKGITELGRAFVQLKATRPTATLTLVGEMESTQYQAELRSIFEAAGVEESVTFMGVLTDQQKAHAYRRASIFCFPTYFESETFGLVVAEAMSARLPVVATRWRGLPSVVDEGVTGLLVNPKDVGALAESLGRIMDDPVLARRLGSNGREKFEQNYTVDRHLRRMRRVLEQVAEGDKCGY